MIIFLERHPCSIVSRMNSTWFDTASKLQHVNWNAEFATVVDNYQRFAPFDRGDVTALLTLFAIESDWIMGSKCMLRH